MRKIILMLLLVNFVSAQKTEIEKLFEKDTISFSYNKLEYLNIAKDTISYIYIKQITLSKENNTENEDLFCNRFHLKNIDLFVIPVFRLYVETDLYYNDNKNIENFIAFNEKNKFQEVLLLNKDTIVSSLNIPNKNNLLKIINSPSYVDMTLEKQFPDDYKYNYIKQLSDFGSRFYNFKNSLKSFKNGIFYFMVLGMENELFELDLKSGDLYINYIGVGRKLDRTKANEYINMYIGEKFIKSISKGDFFDYNIMINVDNKINHNRTILKKL